MAARWIANRLARPLDYPRPVRSDEQLLGEDRIQCPTCLGLRKGQQVRFAVGRVGRGGEKDAMTSPRSAS